MSHKVKGSRETCKLRKCLQQLKKYNPEVEVSDNPTEKLFVGNSSVLCGLALNELEELFRAFEKYCSFIVFPTKRSYSFVIFESVDAAVRAYEELHGRIPQVLKPDAQPFYICYVKNLPLARKEEPSQRPRGFRLLTEFINESEEQALMAVVDEFEATKKTRKYQNVIHFGHGYNQNRNTTFKLADNSIPKACHSIIERMMDASLFSERPDQLTVNIYEPGNGTHLHVDTHSAFGDTIALLSLMSDLVMEFRDSANASHVYDVLLPRFSLAVMQEEARYRWKHGIAERKYDINPVDNRLLHRQLWVSFTFRRIQRQKCQCSFIEYCDWDRHGTMKIPHSEQQGAKIEDEYVASVYESIADHFDTTRHAQWNGVVRFLESLDPGTVVLDVGCGNGKYLKRNDGLVKLGVDLCEKLCYIASGKGCSVVRANVLSLPFKDASVGAVLCIAVIHHLSTEARRNEKVLKNLYTEVRSTNETAPRKATMPKRRSLSTIIL